MSDTPDPTQLSRRERQIMDVIYARGSATAADVLEGIADAPSYSAIRALLRILVEKGHLKHHAEAGKYIYAPTRKRGHVAKDAMKRMLRTFFDDSASKAMAALLESSDAKLTEAELDELSALIDKARKRGQ